ncbi:hypothetical protein G6F36_008540 [Rhizopus arrhizus]|nr:hypothetical protein G6F36_008540 [Rhizopus arrhizus]
MTRPKRTRGKVLEELQAVSDEKIILQAAVDRHRLQQLQRELDGSQIERATKKAKKSNGKAMKLKYFKYLADNNIVDISNSSADLHMQGFNNATKTRMSNPVLLSDEFDRNIEKIVKGFKKIKSIPNLKLTLNICEMHKARGEDEKVVHRIYLHILRLHAEKPWVFSGENLSRYSEFDLQIKFWGYVFETYLGRRKEVVLQWGDTMSNTCKKISLRFKLDLRLLILKDNDMIADGGTGEFARKVTKAKLYADTLKSVVTTKCHLNGFLMSTPYLSEKEVPNVKFPVIQIMGLQGRLSALRIKKKKVYVLESICSFRFPNTLPQIKSGDIEQLVNALTITENMIIELERLYNDGQSSNDENAMTRVLNELPRRKKLKLENWVTDVVWDKADEEDEGGEDAEDENDEDTDDESQKS